MLGRSAAWALQLQRSSKRATARMTHLLGELLCAFAALREKSEPNLSQSRKGAKPDAKKSLVLAVEVLIKIGGIHLHLRPLLRHLDMRRPQNRVRHQPAKIFVAPVLVRMPAGETEAAAAAGALEGPGDNLFAAGMLFRGRRAADVVGRRRLEDRRHLLVGGIEADVEVPLVTNLEW